MTTGLRPPGSLSFVLCVVYMGIDDRLAPSSLTSHTGVRLTRAGVNSPVTHAHTIIDALMRTTLGANRIDSCLAARQGYTLAYTKITVDVRKGMNVVRERNGMCFHQLGTLAELLARVPPASSQIDMLVFPAERCVEKDSILSKCTFHLPGEAELEVFTVYLYVSAQHPS
jgi:hypothetical protein